MKPAEVGNETIKISNSNDELIKFLTKHIEQLDITLKPSTSNTKSNKNRPNSKASYTMLIEKPMTTQSQTQIPISNQLQVLGNILKPCQTFT